MESRNEPFASFDTKISRLSSSLYSTTCNWLILAIGVLLRTAQFLYNRSLTEGEAALALNIVQRSYSELLKPLDYVQAAPVGFLIIQRWALNMFGNSEYSLRIIPLIAGITSLFLFYRLAKQILNEKGLTISLILFTVCDHLIYFSSEVKQYSTDVFFTLIILLSAYLVIKKHLNIKYIIIFGIVGGLSYWFSHPALFIFSGAIIVLLLCVIEEKNWNALFWLISAGVISLISFIVNYQLSLEAISKNRALVDFWQPSFMPLPPTNFNDLKWFPYVFLRTFKFPVGLSVYELLLAVLSFLFGFAVLFYKKTKIFLLLILPILFTLLASGLQKYPFEGRLLLFLTPVMILIIAEGIEYIRKTSSQGSPLIGFALVFILLIHPVCLAGYRLFKPRAPEELRPMMEYVAEHYRTGDIVYVYYASINAFRYYAHRFDYTDNYIQGIEARDNWSAYYKEIEQLKGKGRVWFLFSHIYADKGADEEKLFVSYLNTMALQLDAAKAPGAAAYLYYFP